MHCKTAHFGGKSYVNHLFFMFFRMIASALGGARVDTEKVRS